MDWETFLSETRMLSRKISHPPDMLVGISRGGLVPARILSSQLGVKELHCLSVMKAGEARRVVTDLQVALAGKNVLLVEDMLESGRSMAAAKRYLESKGARVKTACLFTMPDSEIVPDFCLGQISRVEKFPWE